jgi:hypothetical protein
MKTIEEQIFERVFPDEEFNPDNYNDWVGENGLEAYWILFTIANDLQKKLLIKSILRQ